MKEARSVTQAIGDWLFRGTRVYRLSEPNRVLKQKRINWDRQSVDVEDADGNLLCDIPWDDLEFWDPVDYHLPDGE